MITYSQIPPADALTFDHWVEPIIVMPQRPPEGATIHAATGKPAADGHGVDVEWDRDKAKPGDWLEITIPDVALLPVFRHIPPFYLTALERERAAVLLFGLAIYLEKRAEDWKNSEILRSMVPDVEKDAHDARVFAAKLASG